MSSEDVYDRARREVGAILAAGVITGLMGIGLSTFVAAQVRLQVLGIGVAITAFFGVLFLAWLAIGRDDLADHDVEP